MADTADASPFSPYRSDGKLVRSLKPLPNRTSLTLLQYGFICVVTGAMQPIGQAIVQELASMSLNLNARPVLTSLSAHGAACIYGTFAARPLSTATSHLAQHVPAPPTRTLRLFSRPYLPPTPTPR